MTATCIEETGAKPGDFVVCKKMLPTGQAGRFLIGSKYKVFREGRQLKIWGNLMGPRKEGQTKWDLPQSWVGYGFEWEKV